MTGEGGGSERPLRLGLIGCADVAVRRVLPAVRRLDDVELVAVASRDLAKAEAVAAEFGGRAVQGYEPLLDAHDVDAIYLPLPSGLHAPWIGEALSAGKHVLAEKPLTTSSEDTERLHAQAEADGLLLRENYMFTHHRMHRQVTELLARGVIGDIRSLHAVFAIPPRPSGDIRHRPELGGGALLDCGGYPVRAALYFLGNGIDVVGAHLRTDSDLGVDVAGAALLRSAEGASILCEFGFDHSYTSGYRFLGTKGRISVDHVFTTPIDHTPVIQVEGEGRESRITVEADDQFHNSLATFVQDVRSGRSGTDTVTRAQAGVIDFVRQAAQMR